MPFRKGSSQSSLRMKLYDLDYMHYRSSEEKWIAVKRNMQIATEDFKCLFWRFEQLSDTPQSQYEVQLLSATNISPTNKRFYSGRHHMSGVGGSLHLRPAAECLAIICNESPLHAKLKTLSICPITSRFLDKCRLRSS